MQFSLRRLSEEGGGRGTVLKKKWGRFAPPPFPRRQHDKVIPCEPQIKGKKSVQYKKHRHIYYLRIDVETYTYWRGKNIKFSLFFRYVRGEKKGGNRFEKIKKTSRVWFAFHRPLLRLMALSSYLFLPFLFLLPPPSPLPKGGYLHQKKDRKKRMEERQKCKSGKRNLREFLAKASGKIRSQCITSHSKAFL